MIISMVTDENRTGINLTAQAERVKRWNILAGRNPSEPTHEDIVNQWNLVVEEGKETIKGFYEKDIVELMDGVCDVFVVGSYHVGLVANEMGIQLPDLVITEGYVQDSLEGVIGDLDRFIKAEDQRDIAKLIDIVMGLAALVNGNMEGALEAVLDNNDSKFIKNDKDTALEAMDYHTEVKGVECYIDEVPFDGDTYYIIKRKSDNKVLKPHTFVNVDLIPFVPQDKRKDAAAVA